MEPGARRGEEVAPAPAGGEGGGAPRPPDAGPFTLANALTAAPAAAGAAGDAALRAAATCRRALAVYAVAALTDVLDGLAARLLGQHSRFGEILDPIADKLLAFCILVALVTAGRLPAWLAVLVIGRDLALVGAAHRPAVERPAGAHRAHPRRQVRHRHPGGAGAAGAGRGRRARRRRPSLAPWVAATGLLVAACMMVSWAQYGWTLAVELRRARRVGTRPLTSAAIASYEPGRVAVKARSSVVEHYLDTVGVVSSILTGPTESEHEGVGGVRQPLLLGGAGSLVLGRRDHLALLAAADLPCHGPDG